MSEQPIEVRTCGRPTRFGKPCRARIYVFDFACGMHASQHDRELTEVYKRGRSEGFQSGLEMGAGTAKQNVERLERRIQELEQRLDDAAHIYESMETRSSRLADTHTAGAGIHRWRSAHVCYCPRTGSVV